MADKCGHDPCTCVNTDHQGYCSESCMRQQTDEPTANPGGTCVCGHPDCGR